MLNTKKKNKLHALLVMDKKIFCVFLMFSYGYQATLHPEAIIWTSFVNTIRQRHIPKSNLLSAWFWKKWIFSLCISTVNPHPASPLLQSHDWSLHHHLNKLYKGLQDKVNTNYQASSSSISSADFFIFFYVFLQWNTVRHGQVDFRSWGYHLNTLGKRLKCKIPNIKPLVQLVLNKRILYYFPYVFLWGTRTTWSWAVCANLVNDYYSLVYIQATAF